MDTASGLKKVEFAYDYMSRRVQKKVFEWQTDHWSLSTEHWFAYDGWNLIREQTIGGTTSTDYYVWGLDLCGTLQGAGGIGGLLSTTNSLTSKTYLYIFDANGNVGQLVDSKTGAIAAHYEYDPFGNLVAITGSEADNNVFRFSTKYYDVETGLYYYGYRYYDPVSGRWVSRDSLEERGGLNLYGFVRNNSINLIDILGLYTYLGTKYFHGIENSGGELGSWKTIPGEIVSMVAFVRPFLSFDVKTSVRNGGCQCCVINVEFFLKHTVYLPVIGDEFEDKSETFGRPHSYTTIDEDHLMILTEHENAHVAADKIVAKAIFEKAESDFQGKCWGKWFCTLLGRTWEKQECRSYTENKIEQIVVSYFWKKANKAAKKLESNSFYNAGRLNADKYLQWVNDQCASWKEKQFVKKEPEDACQ